MRVKLRGWLRSLELVPWHEIEHGHEPDADDTVSSFGPGQLDAAQLRRLIADEAGIATSLRALRHELDAGAWDAAE